MITLQNYEIYAIDYLEGTLSDDLVVAFEAFLSEHPDIAEEVLGLDNISLPSRTDDYKSKSELKQVPELPAINRENAEEHIIHSINGMLNSEQHAQLEALILNHSDIEELQTSYKQTILKDVAPSYDKHALLRNENGALLLDVMIAYHESLLSDEERAIVDTICADSAAAQTLFNQVAKTKLSAQAVEYPNKSDLKQSEGRVIPIWFGRAAAIAALFVIGWMLWPTNDTISSGNNNLADKDTSTQVPSNLPEDIKEDMPLVADNITDIDSAESVKANKVDIKTTDLYDNQNNLAYSNDHGSKSPNQAPNRNKQPNNNSDDGNKEIPLDLPKLEDIPENNVAFDFAKHDSIANIPPAIAYEKPVDDIALYVSEKENEENARIASVIAKSISKRLDLKDEKYEDELGYVAVKSMERLTDSPTTYRNEKTDDRKVTAFSIGKLGFYRSVKK